MIQFMRNSNFAYFNRVETVILLSSIFAMLTLVSSVALSERFSLFCKIVHECVGVVESTAAYFGCWSFLTSGVDIS